MKTDHEIKKDVLSELRWDPFMKGLEVSVSVKDGIVALSGQVDNYAQKLEAEKAAKRVFGIRGIGEDLRITVIPSYDITDEDLTEAIINIFRWNSAIPEEKITVKVEEGNVTLEGEVDWEYQRRAAINAVSQLLGVRNVFNLIYVKSKTTLLDVKSKINAAFRRSATIDAETIIVDVLGNRLVLRGTTRSCAEKDDVIDVVWSAPGISRVESYLEVEPEFEVVF